MKATLSFRQLPDVPETAPLEFYGCIGYNISGGVVQIIIDEDEVYAYNMASFFSFKYEQEEGVYAEQGPVEADAG